jgi:glycosyltransferase involved in cell wall biosynthesis
VSEREGLLVDPLNVADIAAALAQLAAAPALRIALGRAGRRTARRYSWTRSAALHAEIYQRALQPSAR